MKVVIVLEEVGQEAKCFHAGLPPVKINSVSQTGMDGMKFRMVRILHAIGQWVQGFSLELVQYASQAMTMIAGEVKKAAASCQPERRKLHRSWPLLQVNCQAAASPNLLLSGIKNRAEPIEDFVEVLYYPALQCRHWDLAK